MPIGTLVIRADATPQMGAGHIMRCLALAQAWREKGGDASFVVANIAPFVTKRLSREGFETRTLKTSPGSEDDASKTRTITAEIGAKWLALDGYHFNSRYLRIARHPGPNLLLIDDLGREDCDGEYAHLVLNQNLHAKASMYPGLRHRKLLLGPRFALLRNEFARPAHSLRRFPDVALNVLVSIGGGTQDRTLETMLAAIAMLPHKVNVKVVGGGKAMPHPASATTGNIEFGHEVQDMSVLMDWADAAVSAAGSTCWELCRSGVPSVVVDVAPNQVPVAEELDARGVSIYVPGAQLSPDRMARALSRLLADRERRREMAERGMELVDGKGSARVVAALRGASIHFQKVAWHDARLMWEWANDAEVRSESFFSKPIPWEVHRDWVREKLADPQAQMWIAREEGVAVGVVRLQVKSESFVEIAITVAPQSRGNGLAPHLIQHAVDWVVQCWHVPQLQALIKPKNIASRKAFEAAGFRFCDLTAVNGLEALRYIWESTLTERRKEDAFSALTY